MNLLNDEYVKTGKDLQAFYEELQNVEENTSFEKKSLNSIKLLSCQDFAGNETLIELDPKKPYKKNKKSISLKIMPFDHKYLTTQGYDEDLVKEAVKSGLFIGSLRKPETIVPISSHAISSMAQRAKLGGSNFFKKSLTRDLSISEHFGSDTPVTIVKRKENGLSKVFAVMSSDYSPISQKIISELVERIEKLAEEENFGKTNCRSWYVSNEFTRIYLEFPDMAEEFFDMYMVSDVIPGIMIETSDVGICAFRVKGYIRQGSYITYMTEEYSQIHSGMIKKDEILDAARKSIFPKFSLYPERLAELMMINITDPSMTYEEKFARLKKLCEHILKVSGIQKIIGKKRTKALKEQLAENFYISASVNPGEAEVNVSAYDVAELFISLPSRIENLNQSLIDRIAEATVSVYNFDFNKFLRNLEKEEEEIVIV